MANSGGRRVSDARSNGPRASRALQEGLKETASTVAAMKDANKDLKKQFKQINIDQVEDMQEDMSDLLEQAEEIQSALGRSYNTDDIDEADLEAELEAMEDDPTLFVSSAGEDEDEGMGSAGYLELPPSSSTPRTQLEVGRSGEAMLNYSKWVILDSSRTCY